MIEEDTEAFILHAVGASTGVCSHSAFFRGAL